MNLVIKGNRLIKEIQEEFTAEYPFLKLEFFRNGPVQLNRYPADRQISKQRRLKDAWINTKEEGILQIADNMTVFELEKLLMDRYGLATQVFRKSGNIWLETLRTDNWTLRQQNDHGMEISREEPIKKPDDYDLSRDTSAG